MGYILCFIGGSVFGVLLISICIAAKDDEYERITRNK